MGVEFLAAGPAATHTHPPGVVNVSGAVRSPTQGSKKKEDFYWPEDFVLGDVVWVRSGKR